MVCLVIVCGEYVGMCIIVSFRCCVVGRLIWLKFVECSVISCVFFVVSVLSIFVLR